MKYKILIPIIIIQYIFQCCNPKTNKKISIENYKTGQKIDSMWSLKGKTEIGKTKVYKYILDTNLTCRTFADTIWSIEKGYISESDAIKIRDSINSALNMNKDTPNLAKIADTWSVYEYRWEDTISGDIVYLTRPLFNGEDTKWFLELYNTKILRELESKHNQPGSP
jgi:hypothetical protein